nr:adenylate kinase isoenzyme 1-like [Marmota flaviventris]
MLVYDADNLTTTCGNAFLRNVTARGREAPWALTMLLLLLLGTTDILKSSLIIFVVGGPGCGKETQCKNMATKYGFCHVGLGQLLRQEAQKSTHRGRQIRDMMLQGLLVPSVGWAPDIVIAFDCSMQTMVQRVLHGGQVERRAEDCEVVMFRHLATYYTLCEPVLTFYQQKKLLRNISEEAPENIFAKCCSVIESLW